MDARFLLLVLLVGFFSWSNAAQQLYCPGRSAISCATVSPVIWDGSAFNGQCPLNAISFQAVTTADIDKKSSCGVLNVTITNVLVRMDSGVETTEVISLLSIDAQPSLSGLTIVCRSANNRDVDIELLVPDIPTPNVSVSQLSPTAVTMTLTVGDDRCASMYFVEASQMGSNDPIIMSSSSPSVSVTNLDLCRNRYSIVGYVQASTGMQGGRSSTQIIPSGLEAVTNVVDMQPLRLNWTQPASSAPDDCISDYIISWNGGEDTTVGSSTSVLVSNLRNFPFCQTLILTVTPNTPSGPFSMGTNSGNVMFQHPDFAAPAVLSFFSLESSDLSININWQDISVEAVPLRMFGFSKIGEGVCNPQNTATDSSVTQSVPEAQPGDSYAVCVVFINNECMNRTDVTITVPARLITDPQPTADDFFISVTVTLPSSPPLSPDTLSILSTIDPPHTSDVMADYPISSQQYTVIFDSLIPGTMYTFYIRIVLRNDTATTIGLPVTGSRTIPVCGTSCTVGAVVGSVVFVGFIVIGAVVLLICCYKYKNRCKDHQSTSKDAEKHELTHSSSPPGPDSLYADPNSIEHQPAPGTEDQYAMVDRKGKKNTKPKPTPPEALYQDPNTIAHETAASGDTYAVVDKPKRSSKKKGGPDVVPPASEGLTYADIDLSSKRPKPGSGRQAPQQPGEYPKEHPVEYSSVDHTSQL